MSPTRGRTVLRVVGIAIAVGLSVVAVWMLVFGTETKTVRIGVLAGAWGLVFGGLSIYGPRRHSNAAHSAAAGASGGELEVRRHYELELEREKASRREYELQLEVMLRRELEKGLRAELVSLRREVSGLRSDVQDAVDGRMRLERIETRIVGSNMAELQEEVRRRSGSQETLASLVAAPAKASPPLAVAEPAVSVPRPPVATPVTASGARAVQPAAEPHASRPPVPIDATQPMPAVAAELQAEEHAADQRRTSPEHTAAPGPAGWSPPVTAGATVPPSQPPARPAASDLPQWLTPPPASRPAEPAQHIPAAARPAEPAPAAAAWSGTAPDSSSTATPPPPVEQPVPRSAAPHSRAEPSIPARPAAAESPAANRPAEVTLASDPFAGLPRLSPVDDLDLLPDEPPSRSPAPQSSASVRQPAVGPPSTPAAQDPDPRRVSPGQPGRAPGSRHLGQPVGVAAGRRSAPQPEGRHEIPGATPTRQRTDDSYVGRRRRSGE